MKILEKFFMAKENNLLILINSLISIITMFIAVLYNLILV